MPAEAPVIKFSPFEALLIGEKNKIIKRKPTKNVVFITCLNNRKKSFDLRALFDVEDENAKYKKSRKVLLKNKKKFRYGKNNNSTNSNVNHVTKSHSDSEVYCYEYEGRKVIVKNNELIKVRKRNKNNQSNKVRFKPDFKFKETLEERIVHKIRKRKNLKGKIIGNGMISRVQKKPANRHCLRGKNGKFIRRDEYEQMMNGNDTKYLSNYLKHLYAKKGKDVLKAKPQNGVKRRQSCTIDKIIGLPKKRIKMESDNILDDISKQYYENLFSKELQFPPLPTDLKVCDFDNDSSLLDIVYTSQPEASKEYGSEEDAGIAQRRKGLKMYERKRSSSCRFDGIQELFNNSMKENCINKSLNVNKIENINKSNVIVKGRRNGLNYLIDERPTKDNHLLSQNKFRSLFYKTASGTETYLGNIIKPVLLNSPFGRLPDIS
ncbi:UNVERIFIED_CONTAM: hypothetical protein PYX00_004382 [Menopon gallinae]|uniref:Uncharacterized protein n=1 Tax=Menopon gallinae TaxID=328185 RepID=A0AAW2I3H4_9NEOP